MEFLYFGANVPLDFLWRWVELSSSERTQQRLPETLMLDFVLVAAGVGFFAASLLYVAACEKL